MPRRTMSLLALVTLLGALLAACGAPAAAPTTAPAAGGSTAAPAAGEATAAPAAGATTSDGVIDTSTLIQAFVRNFNPFTFNPLVPTIKGVYEPMMVYSSAKGELVPWLADSYEFSADNKTLTLKLHPGVKWSDGQPFTANDVAYTFNLLRSNPGLQGLGAQVMAEGGPVDTVSAKDDTTVVVTFKEVNTASLYDIVQQEIVPEHVWKDVADPVKFANETPVGTGPFTEVSLFQPQLYQIDKNPNYWQEGKPYINGLRFTAYASNEQITVAMASGKIDWTSSFIPNIEQALLSKDPEHLKYWAPTIGLSVLLELNTTKKPFDDAVVRKAMSMALNREQMIAVALSGYSHPSDVTGLSEGYASWKVSDPSALGDWTTYNPEKAAQMLDEAGYKLGPDGVRVAPDGTPMRFALTLVNGFSDWVSAGQIMVQNWKAIGVEVEPKMIDPGAFFGTHPMGDFEIGLWFGYQTPTPYGFYRNVMSETTVAPIGQPTSANFARYASPKADELLKQFASTSRLEEQKAIAQELQKLFAEEAPVLPLWPAPSYMQYSTKDFTDWPSTENPYAPGFLQGNVNPEQLIVLTTVKPR